MQAEANAKQQIVEKIKNSTNILVTVGNSPSVDSLSAALSLTFMLNRLDKHATAVFSGQLPQAIDFLEPGKTFENTVDSLRDFIIALDKEKADRLRYKVEDEVVRIFITPYKTILSEKDLQFSQGDFNVELIIALGVEKREDLDTAITAHGRILHDASVVTINADKGETSLGSIDWTEPSASSLCEMLMSLSEALQSGLLDQQIATALLTGIVAATDRFRNEHTSPRVMTMAAQLMAAGANQQLIAAKLEEGHVLPEPGVQNEQAPASASTDAAPTGADTSQAADASSKKNDGSLEIDHTPQADASPLPDPGNEALQEAEKELQDSLSAAAPATPTLSINDLQKDLNAATEELEAAAAEPATQEEPLIKKERRTWRATPAEQPAFGGTLNATTSEAEAAKREEELSRRNQQILSHDGEEGGQSDAASTEPTTEQVPPPPAFEPAPESPIVPDVAVDEVAEEVQQPMQSLPPTPEPGSPLKPLESTSDEALSFEPAPIEPTPVSGPTLADLDEQTRGKAAEDARAAVDAALSAMPFNPAGNPLESAGAAPALDLNHETSVEPVQPPVEASGIEQPPLPDVPPAAPGLPPLPDFSTLPPLPGEESPQPPVVPEMPPAPEAGAPDLGPIPSDPTLDTPPVIPPQSDPGDPGQFKIPGQP